MDRPQSPLRMERRLTPELFEHYLAKARAERAKAAAEFWAWVGRGLRAAADWVARLVRPRAVPATSPPQTGECGGPSHLRPADGSSVGVGAVP